MTGGIAGCFFLALGYLICDYDVLKHEQNEGTIVTETLDINRPIEELSGDEFSYDISVWPALTCVNWGSVEFICLNGLCAQQDITTESETINPQVSTMMTGESETRIPQGEAPLSTEKLLLPSSVENTEEKPGGEFINQATVNLLTATPGPNILVDSDVGINIKSTSSSVDIKMNIKSTESSKTGRFIRNIITDLADEFKEFVGVMFGGVFSLGGLAYFLKITYSKRYVLLRFFPCGFFKELIIQHDNYLAEINANTTLEATTQTNLCDQPTQDMGIQSGECSGETMCKETYRNTNTNMFEADSLESLEASGLEATAPDPSFNNETIQVLIHSSPIPQQVGGSSPRIKQREPQQEEAPIRSIPPRRYSERQIKKKLACNSCPE